MTKYLIVGGDSLIGRHLEGILAGRGEVVSTTRRADIPGRLFLDLATGAADGAFSANADVALICASVTRMQDCETDPDGTRRINVTETVRLVRRLAGEGCFVVFLSSNTVFDGRSPFPDEDAAHSPTTEYGRQKSAAEVQMLGDLESRERVAVVRLSKVVTPANGMAVDFLRRLRQGTPCPAFADLLLCPVSLAYVGAGLSAVAAARRPGVFHLSGADEMSYAGFARHLAGRIGADPALVVPGNSAAAGVSVLFRPDHPALGMERTQSLLGLVPEQTEQMLNALES
jgi:dTDP-4-dehydrorhamnose reductase